MSDFFALALGLAFTLVVCLLALQALLGPWLRFRRIAAIRRSKAEECSATPAKQRHDTPALASPAATSGSSVHTI